MSRHPKPENQSRAFDLTVDFLSFLYIFVYNYSIYLLIEQLRQLPL